MLGLRRFAMDGGKRTIAAARKVLELASVLRSRDQRTSTSEALEVANWKLYGKGTDPLQKVCVLEGVLCVVHSGPLHLD